MLTHFLLNIFKRPINRSLFNPIHLHKSYFEVRYSFTNLWMRGHKQISVQGDLEYASNKEYA